jgi:UPF0755 protein
VTRNRIVAIVGVGLALAVIGAFAFVVYQTPNAVYGDDDLPEPAAAATPASGEPLLITIDQGESAETIGAILEEQGIISSGSHFEILVGLTGVQDSLEAGEYEFERGIPVAEAVNRIAQGRTASRYVVIPEGLRAEEIGDILEQANVVTKADFLAALDKSRYQQPFLTQVTSPSLEGYLFPAAYEFSRNVTAEEVVNRLLDGFQTNVADVLQFEGQDFTLEQAVNLAAIVEREATDTAEHPTIASVFENRLRLGMPLQADPTVQFAISADPASLAQYGVWKEELTLEDLEYDSPYNTYVYTGLPPSPIANPGFDTIQSVIRPAETEYLYFVAKGDGTHAFAETLDEHFANVELYQ